MNPLHMLVVEDEAISRKVMVSFLTPLGSCDTAETGKAAVDAFRRSIETGKRYDLITLDIKLPEMNGDEVLQEIRRIETDSGTQPGDGVRIIMTTVMDDPKGIMDTFKNQCDAYIIKPVDKTKLIEQIRKLGLLG